MDTLGSIGEDLLIESLIENAPLASNVHTGPGDDCAVLKLPESELFQLLKTDTIIEDLHFNREHDPFRIGWKAVARVVSDFAAMAGWPDSIVIALAAPKDLSLDFLKEIYRGIYSCADNFNFSIVGGETSSNEKIILTVSGIGYSDSPILRSTASVGNSIYVTGKLGNSIQGKHLNFTPRVKEASWLNKHTNLTAMMDLSDGIAKDLPRLAKLSDVGYQIEFDQIPCNKGVSIQHALSDGEDYELLFTTAQQLTETKIAEWNSEFPKLSLTKIGVIENSVITPLKGGWEHFQSEPHSS